MSDPKDDLFGTQGIVALDEVRRSLPDLLDAVKEATTEVWVEQTRIVESISGSIDGTAPYGVLDVIADSLRMPWVLLNGAVRVAAASTYRSEPAWKLRGVGIAFFAVPAAQTSATAKVPVVARHPVGAGEAKVSMTGPDNRIAAANVDVVVDGTPTVRLGLKGLSGGFSAGAHYEGFVWRATGGSTYEAIAQIVVVIE